MGQGSGYSHEQQHVQRIGGLWDIVAGYAKVGGKASLGTCNLACSIKSSSVDVEFVFLFVRNFKSLRYIDTSFHQSHELR